MGIGSDCPNGVRNTRTCNSVVSIEPCLPKLLLLQTPFVNHENRAFWTIAFPKTPCSFVICNHPGVDRLRSWKEPYYMPYTPRVLSTPGSLYTKTSKSGYGTPLQGPGMYYAATGSLWPRFGKVVCSFDFNDPSALEARCADLQGIQVAM